MLEHGGQLLKASQQFGIPIENWLDLSTGINPISYPIGLIPTERLNRLPENNDRLHEIASRYYQTNNILAVSGSQWAIEHLPLLFDKKRIGVVSPSYFEHQQQWEKAGHKIISITEGRIDEYISKIDILIIVNPNNPTGKYYSKSQLTQWQNCLQNQGGYLIIDEAFLDCQPTQSKIEQSAQDNLIILRSIGKFFGLAGIRIGFVHAPDWIIESLQNLQGEWTIPNTSAWIAEQALADKNWQQKMRQKLPIMREETIQWIKRLAIDNLQVTASTELFVYLETKDAKKIYQTLGQQAILVRQFENPSAIRIGLNLVQRSLNINSL